MTLSCVECGSGGVYDVMAAAQASVAAQAAIAAGATPPRAEVPALEIRRSPTGGGMYTAGAVAVRVSSPQDCRSLCTLMLASISERCGATNSPTAAHVVVTCELRTVEDRSGASHTTKLVFVALAGTQGATDTLLATPSGGPTSPSHGASGGAGGGVSAGGGASVSASRGEAAEVRASLASLSDVLSALCAGNPYIPHRRSKLTYLLQDVLVSDACIAMVAVVHPTHSHAAATLSTLQYASQVPATTPCVCCGHTQRCCCDSHFPLPFRRCSITPTPSRGAVPQQQRRKKLPGSSTRVAQQPRAHCSLTNLLTGTLAGAQAPWATRVATMKRP